MAHVIDHAAGTRRDDGADQVDGEEASERGGREVEGRIREVEIYVGKGAEQREHHAEADRVGSCHPGVAEMAPHARAEGGAAARTGEPPPGRQPGADSDRAQQIENAERDEGPAPPVLRGYDGGSTRPAKPPSTVPVM